MTPTESRMRKAALALPLVDFGSTPAIQAAAAVADQMVAEAKALVTAADALERFVAAREPGADPATDDLTVPLAIELSEVQQQRADLLAALLELRDNGPSRFAWDRANAAIEKAQRP